jgi:hypothetical protein
MREDAYLSDYILTPQQCSQPCIILLYFESTILLAIFLMVLFLKVFFLKVLSSILSFVKAYSQGLIKALQTAKLNTLTIRKMLF